MLGTALWCAIALGQAAIVDEAELALAKKVLTAGEKERLEAFEYVSRSSSKSRKKTLAELKAKKGEYLPTINIKVGEAGLMRDPTMPGCRRLSVIQIIGPDQMIAETDGGTTLWISGVSTAGLADGKKFSVTEPVKIAGTKQYRSVIGATRTVLFVEKWDPPPELLEKAAVELKLKRPLKHAAIDDAKK